MTSLRFLVLFSHTTRVKIHVHYQIHKKKRKRPFTKNRVGRVYITLRQTAGKFSSHMATIYFNILLIPNYMYNIHTYISQLRDQSLRLYIGRYMYSFIDHIIHTLNLHASSMYKHNLFERTNGTVYIRMYVYVRPCIYLYSIPLYSYMFSTHIRENHPILLSFKSSPFRLIPNILDARLLPRFKLQYREHQKIADPSSIYVYTKLTLTTGLDKSRFADRPFRVVAESFS